MRSIWLRLLLLGVIGAVSIVLLPLERLVPPSSPVAQLSPLLLRLLSMVNPLIMVLVASAVGAWTAPKVGLDAPAVRAWSESRPVGPILREQAAAAIVPAIAAALIIILYTRLWGRDIGQQLNVSASLLTALLYGGLAEEVITRWGLMSLLVWVAWRTAARQQPVPGWCFWLGIVLAATLFAAGHLPVLFAVARPSATLIVAVLISNTLAGALFGWLYWRRGLEAAMIAHALAHAIAFVASLV